MNSDCTMFWQVEIKNVNSFSAVSRAIDFEISRQALLYSQGREDEIVQETRQWEEGAQVITESCCCIKFYINTLYKLLLL